MTDFHISETISQTTLVRDVSYSGIGLHSGKMVNMVMRPAPAGSGIVFRRSDTGEQVAAHHDNIREVTLCSTLGKGDSKVGTVEHIMAAFALTHIDNALVEVDAPEIPVIDGSATPFIELIQRAGIAQLAAPRRMIKILREVRVEQSNGNCALMPSEETHFAAEIDFAARAIGKQSYAMRLNGAINEDIARARTFCHLQDVEAMREAGLALGGSVDNAVIVDDDKIINPEGLRHGQEFVQHKILDAIGDMALLGFELVGTYKGYKAGHAMHHALREALFDTPNAYEIITCGKALPVAAS